MKKIILLTLLSCSFAYSQTSHKADPVNRELLKYLFDVEVENGSVKKIVMDKVVEIEAKTTDTIVKKQAGLYIKELNELKIPDLKKVDFKKTPKESLKNFKVNEDKFKEAIFITHKKNSQNRIKIYIGIVSGEAMLRYVTEYYGSGWIFMNKGIVLVDGNKYTYNIKNPKREVQSGANVIEKSDQLVNQDLYAIIEAIVNAKNDVEIRLDGDKSSKDLKLFDREVLAIKETLELFNSLSI